MDFLIYSNPTCETGRALAEYLGIESGHAAPNSRIDTLIRWGSSEGVGRTPRKVLNKKNAIALCANKLNALEVMRGTGLNVPRSVQVDEYRNYMGDQPKEFLRNRGIAFPFLARKIHHTKGTDILLCMQEVDIRRAIRWGREVFTEYIPTAREYRIHVFDGEIIRTSQKVLMTREGYVPYIRNYENSHTYRDVRDALREEDEHSAILAVTSLGLDFGAVDMVIGDNGIPYILEVNTGPSLIDTGIEIYGNKFREHLTDRTANVPTARQANDTR